MHRNIIAWQEVLPAPCLDRFPSCESLLIDLLVSLSQDFGQTPQVFFQDSSSQLWYYFPGSSVVCDDFFSDYGLVCACIQKKYPLFLYGSTSEKEPAKLAAHLSPYENQLLLKKQNISGKDFTQLSDLCVKIETNSRQNALEFFHIFKNFQWQKEFLVMKRTEFTEFVFSREEQLHPDTFFRFIKIQKTGNYDNCVFSLSVTQWKKLWNLFLHDHISPLEFDFALSAYDHAKNLYPFAWDLALRMALNENRICITYHDHDFRITDSSGHRISYNFERGSAAEKLFLKLLFPVAAPRQS